MINWICNKLNLATKHELNSAGLWRQLEVDMLTVKCAKLSSKIERLEFLILSLHPQIKLPDES